MGAVPGFCGANCRGSSCLVNSWDSPDESGVPRITEDPLLFVLFIEGDAIFERCRIQPVDGLSADLSKGVHQVVDGLSLLRWVEDQVTPFRHSDPVRI